MVLFAMIRGPNDGIMVPIPQYPCTRPLSLYMAVPVPYYLDEDNEWSLNIPDLQKSIDEARARAHVCALCFHQPRNPTGQCLSEEAMADLIQFAFDNERISAPTRSIRRTSTTWRTFYSARMVLNKMPEPIRSSQELVSSILPPRGLW